MQTFIKNQFLFQHCIFALAICLRSFLFIALICLSISSFSATLSQLQKGTTTFPAASGSTTQAISNVNLDETFLVFSIRVADNAPGDFQISGYFSDTDELTFTRHNVGGSPAVTIEWRVISFSSGVYVQHGTATNVGGGGVNVTLSSIDTNESFAIATHKKVSSLRYFNKVFPYRQIFTQGDL